MIQLGGVSKVYRSPGGAVRALDDVGLSVAPGEFVTVRGPSGCGKTTLLLTVGGMIRPTEGRVLLGEQNVYALSPGERAQLRATRIGFVFQMFHLVPYLSVLENTLLPALAARSADRDEAAALLERLQLGPRLGHKPSALSAGERQRVALARALVSRPPLLLADEPTGNLDPENAAQVLGHLADYHAAGGTLLLVTHSALADEYAQRVLLMEKGQIREDARTESGAADITGPAGQGVGEQAGEGV